MVGLAHVSPEAMHAVFLEFIFIPELSLPSVLPCSCCTGRARDHWPCDASRNRGNGKPGPGCPHPPLGLLSRAGSGVTVSPTGSAEGFFLVLVPVTADKTEKVI